MGEGAPVRLLVATRSRHKLRELRDLLNLGEGVELLSPDDLGIPDEPEETGETFETNARIKAAPISEQHPDAVVVGADVEPERLHALPSAAVRQDDLEGERPGEGVAARTHRDAPDAGAEGGRRHEEHVV